MTSHRKVLGQIWKHPRSRYKTSRANKTDTKEQERAPTVAGILKSRILIQLNSIFTMEINCCQKTWSLATPNQSLWRIAYSRRPSTRIEMFESQLRNLSTGTILKIFLSLMKTIWKSHRLTSTNFRMLLWSKWDSVRSTLGTRSLGRYSSHHPWRASSFGRRSTSTRCSKAKWKSRREQASNTMRIVSFLFSILQQKKQPKDHLKSRIQRDHRSRTSASETGWPSISKQL